MLTTEDRTRAQEAKRSTKSVDQLMQQARLHVNQAQESAIACHVASMPETCRRTYLRAMHGRSLSAAVKAFCMECVQWNREEVAHCTALACPLYPYRPFGRERQPCLSLPARHLVRQADPLAAGARQGGEP